MRSTNRTRLCGLTSIVIPLAVVSCSQCFADDLKGLRRLEKTYSISIEYQDVKFPVDLSGQRFEGRIAKPAAIEDYAPILVSQFGRLPPELVKKSGLQRIVLCSHLCSGELRMNAAVDLERDTLYFDVRLALHEPDYLKHAVHHEFFHILDYNDKEQRLWNERWSRLNVKGFSYGDGGWRVQKDATQSLFLDPGSGFINKYSMSAIAEDRAEVFTMLTMYPRFLDRYSSEDKIVAAKVRLMQQFLKAAVTPSQQDKKNQARMAESQ